MTIAHDGRAKVSGASGVVRNGDAYDLFPEIPANSVDLILTSPPYWGLRDYGLDHDHEILKHWVAAGNDAEAADWCSAPCAFGVPETLATVVANACPSREVRVADIHPQAATGLQRVRPALKDLH